MDRKQGNALQPFDEEWFDVANACGKEFELPNASSPLNPLWSDNNLCFMQDQLHTPDILDSSYQLEMSSPWAGSQVDSFQMMPSITNSVLRVDPQEGSSKGNHKVYFPRSTGLLKSEFEGAFPEVSQHVNVPTLASHSWKVLDIDSAVRNQEFPVTSTNSSSIGSTDSLCLKYNPTHATRFANTSGCCSNTCIPTNCQLTRFCTSPSGFRLDSDDSMVNGQVCFSSSGCSPSFGSSGCPSARNQEIRSSNFTDPPSRQIGSCARWNPVAYVPAVTNTYGASANGEIVHGANPLQNVSHNTGITPNVPVLVESQIGTSIHAPRSNGHSSEDNQAHGPSSSKNGRCNVKYTCKVCKREFPNYNSYGGHMSYHAKVERAKHMPFS